MKHPTELGTKDSTLNSGQAKIHWPKQLASDVMRDPLAYLSGVIHSVCCISKVVCGKN